MASFLTILIIIFVSPLYFLLRKRWLGLLAADDFYGVQIVSNPSPN